MTTTLDTNNFMANLLELARTYPACNDSDRSLIAGGLAEAYSVMNQTAISTSADSRTRPEVEVTPFGCMQAQISIVYVVQLLGLEDELQALL